MIDDGYPIVDKWVYQIGARAGALTVGEIDKERFPNGSKGGKFYVHWTCDCGRKSTDPGQKSKRIDNIRAGALGKKGGTRSCGHKQNNSFVKPNNIGLIQDDLTNKEFNGIKVLKKTGLLDSNRSAIYEVECPICHKPFLLSGRHLKDKYHAATCGCVNNTAYGVNSVDFSKAKSALEQKVIDILTSYNIPFIKEKQFSDLLSENNAPLSYDFYLESPKYGPYIIETDGEQHFKNTTFSSLNIVHNRDLKKNKYAWDHNIKLIRIPYCDDWEPNDLSIKTTKYELTKDNEQLYYDKYLDINWT